MNGNNPKWKVRRARNTRWRKTYLLKGWRVYSPEGRSVYYAATHAEALAEADRRARIVQVELPASPWRVSPFIRALSGRDGVIVMQHGGEELRTMYLNHAEVKPVALALLAIHYQALRHGLISDQSLKELHHG